MPKLKVGVIRKLREQKCWTQEDLAIRAGVAVRTLQRAESGESAKLDTIAFVAEALQVSAGDLLQVDELPESIASHQESTSASLKTNTPIPVVLRRIFDGKALLDGAINSLAMLPEARGVADAADGQLIGALFDDLRDYMDVATEMSFTDQFRYGVELTRQISALQDRGWWVLAGSKRHSIRWDSSKQDSMPWTTFVIVVARADDSIISHREDGEPVALVGLPAQFRI